MIRSETFATLKARWLTILVFVLLGVLLASLYVMFAPREYSASTRLLVSASTGTNGSDLAQGGTFSQQQARNYSNIATSEIVLQPVIDALDLQLTVTALGRKVSSTIPLNTSVIQIEVTDSSPVRAAAIANSVTTSLVNTVGSLVPTDADGRSLVGVDIVQRATVPSRPSSPNALIALFAGAVGGLVAGVAYVIIARRISSRVRTAAEARRLTNAPVLGTIRFESDVRERAAMADISSRSVRAEEYRQVRTNVGFLQMGNAHKAFAITSSVPGEGKSTTSANLAASLASIGRSVCLIEADLRKPSLGGYLDLESSIGLTTVLSGDADLDDALQTWGYSGLQVLLAGEVPPNPSELLSSPAAADLIATLRARFEIIIVDTPPILPVTDGAIIGNLLGGVILVIGLGKVRERELAGTIEALTVSHTPVLGTVLNMAASEHTRAYEYGYGSTASHEAREGAEAPRVTAES
ncbi:polysaccharide biosynthesis tyrosine autokinase [Microbacterium fluvii]|uniref:Polysaccharide biosynthesis tyrosine autokinase n=1 Tax=Microbacterium fluvii TaxID=415215 RepID=A0ABW2HHA6_9MICO|nr:polysaccharide biosynthesis tyrosine autokinase [Microbacterium fluvii]MCU4673940.1 polysaccharide biosynthesis tyrosine autokinase [Microbacterium fluvii]